MASDSRKCRILSAYCKKQVMGRIGGGSDGWRRNNALCQTLNLIIQHESYRQNCKLSQTTLEMHSLIMKWDHIIPCTTHRPPKLCNDRNILTVWMRCNCSWHQLAKNHKNRMVTNVRTRFIFGSMFCNLTPCNYITIFFWHCWSHTTVGRTPLDEWSARRIYFYMTTHNTHKRQTSVPPLGFEPTISAGEWPQTYALDQASATYGTRAKPSVARGTIFNGTLSELKYSNYDLIKIWIFN